MYKLSCGLQKTENTIWQELTNLEELVPGGGVTAPERRVQLLVQLLADDEIQRRAEHLLQRADELLRPLGHRLLQATQASLEQESASR